MPYLTENKARQRLIEKANAFIVKMNATRAASAFPYLAPTLTMKHLQRAVFICRQNRLVKPLVLERAGFNAVRRRG